MQRAPRSFVSEGRFLTHGFMEQASKAWDTSRLRAPDPKHDPLSWREIVGRLSCFARTIESRAVFGAIFQRRTRKTKGQIGASRVIRLGLPSARNRFPSASP